MTADDITRRDFGMALSAGVAGFALPTVLVAASAGGRRVSRRSSNRGHGRVADDAAWQPTRSTI